jgi:soluble lytic murein transglycosylase
VRKQAVPFAILCLSAAGWVSPAAAQDSSALCSFPARADDLYFTPRERAEPPRPIEVLMCVAPSELLPDALPDARVSLTRARSLAERGQPMRAVLELRTVAAAYPMLADRLALEEGAYRMAAGPDAAACETFARAEESPHRAVAARARIERVRCQLRIADRRAPGQLAELRRSYPELPQVDELTVLLGGAHEAWGDTDEAIDLYRQVDLTSPGSPAAASARVAMERLRARGVEVRELTLPQAVERADRLSRTGPHVLARAEIARLRAMPLPRNLALAVARSAARMAREEGRWADAQALLREAQGLPTLEPEERALMEEQEAELARASESRDLEDVRQRIRGLTRGARMSGQNTARLYGVLAIATRAGLRDETNDVLALIAGRDRIPPGLRFDAAILAAGTGDDARVAQLFASVREHPTFGVAARYHYARTLERMNRLADARAEYARVIEHDDRRLPFYALWARTRLRATANAGAPAQPVAELYPPLTACEGGPFSELPADAKTDELRANDTSCAPPPPNPYVEPAPPGEVQEAVVDPLEEVDAAATEAELEGAPRPSIDLSDEEIVALLEPIATEHAEAFPYLPRAAALVALGDRQAAADELHEAFVAYRDSNGGDALRADLAAVLRGGAPPRMRVSPSTWRDRRRLPREARMTLARVAAALGDHGLAIRFGGGFNVAGPRPRAYEQIVEAAARRHGVEPELLFAVMRVESVYNPRIISYAGAIGLMQIMPRTGRLIANAVGRNDFTVDMLLDPNVNIDFAAWYLASLIERFDGRIPLAIASYNGGPHNVRRWMRDHSETMPLEAFLERIPFDQTHRYVRRVLTHYAAYRAQRGLPPPNLDVTLPDAQPDAIAF